jgi:hypothetical protein
VLTMLRLLHAEALKLKRSPALRLIWLLPCLFVFLDFAMTGRFALGVQSLTPEIRTLLQNSPVKSLADYWSGYFHPLLVALLPALLFRPEHRSGLWKHLHIQPVSRRAQYLIKALTLALTFGLALGLTEVLLWSEWVVLGKIHPLVAFPFPWFNATRVMAWSYLGSLPLLALYLWLSDRISNAAVPVMFAVVGFILTVSMGGKELDPMWRRDFIPWVLPYTCAQQAIEDPGPRQTIHAAQVPYYKEDAAPIQPGEFTAGGRHYKIELPEDFMKPTPPTPAWMLATFSLVCSFALLGLGVIESGRNRA